ncbi:hypothetical protein T440DRAFT_57395 [Plenodomus tracheiphilus IPT5]|uniref:Uncharacterized protein n=1 Tax=Plenodomus tracheiphilus IPT5 TaxID=1408161 RepID=A0A6A7BC64_9PLEO|nr:hypothetical protein T440DRAFT_57395 [Plenodomus tracheiphilus IPT5]
MNGSESSGGILPCTTALDKHLGAVQLRTSLLRSGVFQGCGLLYTSYIWAIMIPESRRASRQAWRPPLREKTRGTNPSAARLPTTEMRNCFSRVTITSSSVSCSCLSLPTRVLRGLA